MSFPLHRLPNPVQIYIFRFLGPLELIAIYLFSTRVKNQVKFLKFPAEKLLISIQNQVIFLTPIFENGRVNMVFNVFDTPIRHDLLEVFPTVNVHEIFENVSIFRWGPPGVTFKKWLDHLNTIFRYSEECSLEFSGGNEIIDSEPLKNSLPTIHEIRLYSAPGEFAQKILRTFAPVTKNLTVWHDVFTGSSPHILEKVGIQNLDILNLRNLQSISLDNLAIMNTNVMNVYTFNPIPLKNVNRFIKIWIKKANSRMKHVHIQFESETIPNVNMVLKGIPYQMVPENGEGRSGFGIRRKDGKLATIRVSNVNFMSRITGLL